VCKFLIIIFDGPLILSTAKSMRATLPAKSSRIWRTKPRAPGAVAIVLIEMFSDNFKEFFMIQEHDVCRKDDVFRKDNACRKDDRDPSASYIKYICELYNDKYDDREEDSRPGGGDWVPGGKAAHTSLAAFKAQLSDYGIELSTAKIRKILITGGCWSTERSREVADLYEKYGSIRRVADELGLSRALVTMYLPYGKVVYDLEDKSSNARRIERWRRPFPDDS
jgi:hypothetical protein